MANQDDRETVERTDTEQRTSKRTRMNVEPDNESPAAGQGDDGAGRENESQATPGKDKRRQDSRQQGRRQQDRQEQAVLLNSTPTWLNWAAVTLAVLIVAGIFILSARQLNAPDQGVSANQTNGIQAGVGGMRLDAGNGNDAENAGDSDASGATAGDAAALVEGEAAQNGNNSEILLLANGEPGMVLINPVERVQLYADAHADAHFLDSYARGGRFVVVEPTADYGDYPVVVERDEWVRVRAADGLVGWTPAASLEVAP
jgi:hypothetical protein